VVYLGIPYQSFDGHPPFYQDGWSMEDYTRVFEEYQNNTQNNGDVIIRKPTKNELKFCQISDSYA